MLAGASFEYGAATPTCQLNCRIFVSNAAGSDGSLLVSGIGSTFTTPGGVVVGNASVFTLATDGFNYGTPGGVSQATARVAAGGIASSSFLSIGQPGGGLGRTGAEQSMGSVVIDGIGSVWNLVRNAAQVGDQALLRLGTGTNAQGTLAIQNGGRVRIDGSAGPGVFTGANIGSGGPTSSGLVRVDGAGSRLEVAGPQGFINVGVNSAGSSGELRITNGGVVTGIGDGALPFVTLGRNGGSGVLNVSGNDAAGNASLLRLAGHNPLTDGGAFLNVGGSFTTSGASSGTANVSAGGRLEIDTTSLVLTNPNGQTGMYIGVNAGATGAMTINGKSALTGVASTVAITASTGLAPYIGIGRDGATGDLSITGGGRLLIDSAHTSVPNPVTYLQGDAMSFEVGRRVAAGPEASTGTVTVSGLGSELAMTGSVDRLIQLGLGTNTSGALNIFSGGTVRSEVLLVGNNASATGVLNMNGGQLVLAGARTGGPVAGNGGGMAVGRGGGRPRRWRGHGQCCQWIDGDDHLHRATGLFRGRRHGDCARRNRHGQCQRRLDGHGQQPRCAYQCRQQWQRRQLRHRHADIERRRLQCHGQRQQCQGAGWRRRPHHWHAHRRQRRRAHLIVADRRRPQRHGRHRRHRHPHR